MVTRVGTWIELTMSSASTRHSPSTAAAGTASAAAVARMIPAGGIGNPRKYSTSCTTAKRARRHAPATTKIKPAPAAKRGIECNRSLWIINAGATPKETKSASESSWHPNAPHVSLRRATQPSIASRMPARATARAAARSAPSPASSTAMKPAPREQLVITLAWFTNLLTSGLERRDSARSE